MRVYCFISSFLCPPRCTPVCFASAGEVIVFANQKAKVEAVVAELVKAGAKAAAIHGDMDQVGAL
jgi:superfamily II DNA/RNA helicase